MSEKSTNVQTELITKKGWLETSILDFSNNIFYNKRLGIMISILINCIYIYLCYHKTPIISIVIFLYFLYLFSHIILYQLKGSK